MIRNIVMLAAAVMGCSIASRAQGQAVQLPQFEFSGVQTTVVVPNTGQIVIGGIKSSGGSQNGPGIGMRSAGGGMGITATVHDLEALDRAVLAEAARRRAASGTATAPRASLTPAERATMASATMPDSSTAMQGARSLRELRRARVTTASR